MRIKKITTIPDFPMPRAGSEFAGAWDLHAAITEPVTLAPGEQCMIGTGYAWEIPRGHVGLLLPRSGTGRDGLVLGNSVGVVDSDYRGEVMACAWNRNTDSWLARLAGFLGLGRNRITINPGDRFCQLLVVETWMDELVIVDELTKTERGGNGFGSSGRAA